MEPYELIRSRRKTLALEITGDCRVVVRAPMRLSEKRIRAFVESHGDWIRQHLERQRQRAAALPPPPTAEEIAALKARAQKLLPPKIAFWSKKMGVTPTGFRVTAAKHRYGSCSGKNSLCFSCFLMNCPEEAIELVVVHELCHIREKNHGPRFYALLEQYLPDYRERKKLLK
ncbi:MAG: M48 family metallopeptidase [Oscillibacter sp.]|jgi:predicted metal-dependent hydrolase|nr:M48 family metallopeptidase [Oscillibacter sp.]